MTFNTGDILLFKGNGLLSTIIMAAPGAEYSHVGMYVDHPDYGPCVFESTSLGALPDMITGEPICGVQLVSFDQRVAGYDGEVFHRPIRGVRTKAQLDAMLEFINEYHGTPYEEDNLQLARAELDIFPWHRNTPDASSLFCSETVVMCARQASLIVDDGMSPNEFTPTDCSDGSLVLSEGLTFGSTVKIPE